MGNKNSLYHVKFFVKGNYEKGFLAKSATSIKFIG